METEEEEEEKKAKKLELSFVSHLIFRLVDVDERSTLRLTGSHDYNVDVDVYEEERQSLPQVINLPILFGVLLYTYRRRHTHNALNCRNNNRQYQHQPWPRGGAEPMPSWPPDLRLFQANVTGKNRQPFLFLDGLL